MKTLLVCGTEKYKPHWRGDKVIEISQLESKWIYEIRTLSPLGHNVEFNLNCFILNYFSFSTFFYITFLYYFIPLLFALTCFFPVDFFMLFFFFYAITTRLYPIWFPVLTSFVCVVCFYFLTFTYSVEFFIIITIYPQDGNIGELERVSLLMITFHL